MYITDADVDRFFQMKEQVDDVKSYFKLGIQLYKEGYLPQGIDTLVEEIFEAGYKNGSDACMAIIKKCQERWNQEDKERGMI